MQDTQWDVPPKAYVTRRVTLMGFQCNHKAEAPKPQVITAPGASTARI